VITAVPRTPSSASDPGSALREATRAEASSTMRITPLPGVPAGAVPPAVHPPAAVRPAPWCGARRRSWRPRVTSTAGPACSIAVHPGCATSQGMWHCLLAVTQLGPAPGPPIRRPASSPIGWRVSNPCAARIDAGWAGAGDALLPLQRGSRHPLEQAGERQRRRFPRVGGPCPPAPLPRLAPPACPHR
jgi:hypothetical protein